MEMRNACFCVLLKKKLAQGQNESKDEDTGRGTLADASASPDVCHVIPN